MRTSFVTVAGVLALTLLAGCTTKDVDPPTVAGPSTLARAISMTANRDTLFQNGVDFVDITITSTSPTGQSQAIPLRAEIMVDGVIQDFGSLSTKSPVTPATIRYTAPNASPLAAGQVAQVVTVAVTPVDSGDFRAEVARQVNLRLVPQGVILPTNPNLTAVITAPATTPAFSPVTFDASASTNGAAACNNACSYAWNFGDGTTGSGMVTTHEFRTISTLQVTLTVTDSRGAVATDVHTINVTASTPPTAVFTINPNPAGPNQEVFFSAEQSTAVLPRRIVSYGWSFGDGRTASGVTVSRSFSTLGSYTILLTVTDDVGAFRISAPQTLTISNAGAGLTAAFTISPTNPKANSPVFFNASGSTSTGAAKIVTYAFSYGDGSPDDVGTSPTQSHTFSVVGGVATTYTVRLTVTDSLGRTATTTSTVAVSP
jgi:PKD repeat protein